MSTSPEEEKGFEFSTSTAKAVWSPASESRGRLHTEEISIVEFRWRNRNDGKEPSGSVNSLRNIQFPFSPFQI